MKIKNTIIRYMIMLPGLFLLCMGIALLAKAGIGTSPISSIPYSLSLIAPAFTMGTYIVMINVILLLSQMIMLHDKPGELIGRSGGKALPWQEVLLQFLLSFATGYLVDLSLFLFKGISPSSYLFQLLLTLIACWLMGTGIFIQLRANVAMAPGDAFSRALSAVTGQPYNRIRVTSDTAMVVIALALCLFFLRRPAGVREGTLICAFLVGNIVKMNQKIVTFFNSK